MAFGLILDESFTRHETPPGHPERPERVLALVEAFKDWKGRSGVVNLAPEGAVRETVLKVHTAEHFQKIEATANRRYVSLDPDTHTGQFSFETALLAAGSAVKLVRAQLDGEISSGILLARPPGHHAERNRAMGFCLFNTVAIAAAWALEATSARRAAIIDFDVHHGNGTQEIFYDRSDVLYVSTHQYPFYPGTGSFEEAGRGKGRGYTLNFPIRAGAGDFFYCSLYKDLIIPEVRDYRPDLILISAGYDAHRLDPLAGMKLTARGFAQLSMLLQSLAEEVCNGRILYFLEGGYDLEGLSSSVLATVSACLKPSSFEFRADQKQDYEEYRVQAERVLEHLRRIRTES